MINEGTHSRLVGEDETIDDPVLIAVRSAILAIGLPHVTAELIAPESLLVEDLGIESLEFVDLTASLEDALGLEEFPMQVWIDGELAKGEPLSVQALVAACRKVGSHG